MYQGPRDIANPYGGARWEPSRSEGALHALRVELIGIEWQDLWSPQAAYDAIEQVIAGFRGDDECYWECYELERAPAYIFFTADAYIRFCYSILGWLPVPGTGAPHDDG